MTTAELALGYAAGGIGVIVVVASPTHAKALRAALGKKRPKLVYDIVTLAQVEKGRLGSGTRPYLLVDPLVAETIQDRMHRLRLLADDLGVAL